MKLSFSLIGLLFAALVFAQDTLPQPALVIGIESNFLFHDLEDTRRTPGKNTFRYGYGLHLEKPFGQWGVNLGILRQEMGNQTAINFTGDVLPPQTDEDDPSYVYEQSIQKLSYWSLPLRLQYRLPCNCVYVQAGLIAKRKMNQAANAPYIFNTNQVPDELVRSPDELAQWAFGYTLDAGFNLYFTDQIKLFSRLSLVNHGFRRKKLAGNFYLSNKYLSLSMGLQFAIPSK